MYQHDKYKLDTSKPKTYEQQISYFIELMIDQL